jgi:predicted HAD superfamily Cof-like phosphohydrolase
MVEELAELVTAMHEENVIEIADALADLLYVVIGTGLAYGLPIAEVFNEVHRSNMSKNRLNQHGKGGKGNGFSPPNLEEILRKAGWVGSASKLLDLKY